MIHHAREKHQMFSEKQIMFWFIQILLAVGYLHELRVYKYIYITIIILINLDYSS